MSAAVLRQQEARIQRLEADYVALRQALQSRPAHGGGGGGGIPKNLGAGWDFLKRIPWSDRLMMQSHSMTFEVELEGVGVAGAAIDGPAVVANTQVVADDYFFVHTLTGRLEYDMMNPDELWGAQYVRWQLGDDSRNADYGRTSMPFSPLVGENVTVRGAALRFDDAPMGWYPNARILVTFTPMAGYGMAAAGGGSSTRGTTTRQAEITLHGMRVRADLVDKLIADNREFLLSLDMVG